MKSRLGPLGPLACLVLSAAAVVIPALPANAALPAPSGDITVTEHHLEFLNDGHHLDGDEGDKVLVISFHDATPSTANPGITYTIWRSDEPGYTSVPSAFNVAIDGDGNGRLVVLDELLGDYEIAEYDAEHTAIADRTPSFRVDHDFTQPDEVFVNMDEVNGEGAFVAGRRLEFTWDAPDFADGATFSHVVLQEQADPAADPVVLAEGSGWPDYSPPATLVGKEIAVIVAATLDDAHYDSYFVWSGRVVRDTTAPDAPASVSIRNVTNSSITVEWSAVDDDVAVTGYDVYLNGQKVRTVGATTQSVVLDGLVPSTGYSAAVRAFDAAGNVSDATTSERRTTEAADTTRPSLVPSVVLTSKTTTSFELRWEPATDDVGVTGYEVIVDGARYGSVLPATTRSAVLQGLAPGSSHTYSVRAFDAAGNRSWDVWRGLTMYLEGPLCFGWTPEQYRQRGFRVFVGTEGRDVLRGTRKNDVFFGLGGDDVLIGKGGPDLLCGGAGVDVLNGGAGPDYLYAVDGSRDRVLGGPGRDAAHVDPGGETAVRSIAELRPAGHIF